MNLYAYTDNDPLNLTDPSGNCPWCIPGAIGAVVGGGVELISNRKWTWTSLGIAAGSGFVAGATGGGGVALAGRAFNLTGLAGRGAAVTSELAGSGLATAGGNIISQGAQNVTGLRQDFSATELGFAFAAGGAAAYARAGIAATGGKQVVGSSIAANTAVEATVAGNAGVADLSAKYVQRGSAPGAASGDSGTGLYINQNLPMK